LEEAGVYVSADDAFQHSLVVLAMGRACWIVADERGHRLLVEPGPLTEVRRQLASFDHESTRGPPKPFRDPAASRRGELLTPLLWAMLTLAIFWGEPTHPQWITVGELDPQAIFGRHEWWRPLTALFLHADAAHVLSNGLSGMFVFAAVTTAFGRARGWTLLAIAAIGGNIASAAVNHATDYHSIGASTAVFAAVGLLTGRAVRLLFHLPTAYRTRAMFVPFATGAVVLALYGVGGSAHIDVGAHLTGFVAGVMVALVGTGRLPNAADTDRARH
jgi:rhomboid protease GluP